MSEVNIIKSLHTATKRDYLARMTAEKPECMRIARQFGKEYFDGHRKYGYGGYHYDGRFKPVAKALAERYGLNKDSRIFDFGCAKGFLMRDLDELLGCKCRGWDISSYAMPDSMAHSFWGNDYDLVVSLGTLHNLQLEDLKRMIRWIELNGKHKYITLDSYRNEQELCNLQCWALTCEQFFQPEEWEFLFKEWGYTGDYEFLFFE